MMALTGQAKTDYQRDYMRRRRSKLAQLDCVWSDFLREPTA